MPRGDSPRSRANLAPAWSPGQSGNPNGRPPKRQHAARRLLRLLEDGATDQAERLMLGAFARGEPWALDLVLNPPPAPSVIDGQGARFDPIELGLPGTPGWRVLAAHLREIARARPARPPVALLRAVKAPQPELYGCQP